MLKSVLEELGTAESSLNLCMLYFYWNVGSIGRVFYYRFIK